MCFWHTQDFLFSHFWYVLNLITNLFKYLADSLHFYTAEKVTQKIENLKQKEREDKIITK